MSAVEDSLETQARIGALRCEGGPHSPTGHLLRRLADEIERLRAEVAALRADLKPDIARAAVTALGLWPAQDRNIPLAFIEAARNYHRATVDAIDAALAKEGGNAQEV